MIESAQAVPSQTRSGQLLEIDDRGGKDGVISQLILINGPPASKLVARELAGAAVVEHLHAGRDVVMAQYFGRLGNINLLEDLAREHCAAFVEVILATNADLAIDRFRARRRAMTDRGEHHPERDIAVADVVALILAAVERLTRLPTARPESLIVPVALEASEDEVHRRMLSVLGE